MITELKTLDVLDKLRALHQHYITLLNISDEDKKHHYSNLAQGVRNSIHEIELMAGCIDSEQ